MRIDLSGLSAEKKKLYQQAREKFQDNTNWLAFDEFAFGKRSPIYSRESSHLDVLNDPLYRALKAMWLQLGMRQGMIASGKRKNTAA